MKFHQGYEINSIIKYIGNRHYGILIMRNLMSANFDNYDNCEV